MEVLKLYKITYALLDKESIDFEILDVRCIHCLAYSPEEAKHKCILQVGEEIKKNKNLEGCYIQINDNEDIEEIVIGESQSILA